MEDREPRRLRLSMRHEIVGLESVDKVSRGLSLVDEWMQVFWRCSGSDLGAFRLHQDEHGLQLLVF